jgi:hypothetical protein
MANQEVQTEHKKFQIIQQNQLSHPEHLVLHAVVKTEIGIN